MLLQIPLGHQFLHNLLNSLLTNSKIQHFTDLLYTGLFELLLHQFYYPGLEDDRVELLVF